VNTRNAMGAGGGGAFEEEKKNTRNSGKTMNKGRVEIHSLAGI